jgi:hypothetical protein
MCCRNVFTDPLPSNGYTRYKENEMNEARSTYARDGKCVQNFNWEREGKRSAGRPRCTWVDNIKIEHRNRIEGMDSSSDLE